MPLSVVTDAVLLRQADRRLLAKLGEGLSNKELARYFGLSEQTVKNRLGILFLRLGAEDRLQVVLLAHAAGIIDLNRTAATLAKRVAKAGTFVILANGAR